VELGAGLAAAGIVAGLLWMQHQAVVGSPDGLEKVRRQLASAIPLLPHTTREHRLFRWLALTAGICEEILFRGFVLWYVQVWTGLVPAAVVSCVVFGLAHAYLGSPHVLRTALFGAFLVLLVLVSRSLWPAMIVHAAVDLNSGDLSFRALSARTPAL
jgi:membrane protease YdiL (CAAX protease family)